MVRHCPAEMAVMMEMLHVHAEHLKCDSVTSELDFKFSLVLTTHNITSNSWVAEDYSTG